MEQKTTKQIVQDIDYMIGRQWDLSQKEKLTEEETRELRGYSIKMALFQVGQSLSGMTLKEYLSLTDRDWGDKAQKEIAEGKRKYDDRTEDEIKAGQITPPSAGANALP